MPRERKASRHGDAGLVVLGALLISAKGIIAKFLFREGATVEAILLLRAVIALPMIWGWALYRVGPRRLFGGRRAAIAGALLAGVTSYYAGAWLDFVALTMISASLERVLLFTYPVIVVVARAVILRRWPPLRVVVAVCVTYAGVICAVGGFDAGLWRTNGTGAMLILGAACGFAYYLIANERAAAVIGSVPFIAFATLAATIALALHFAVLGTLSDLDLTPRAWGLLLLMTAVTNVVPLFLISASVSRIGAQRASIISSIGPPATIVMAVLLLGESLHLVQVLGSALIITGIIILEARRGAAVATE